MLEKSEEQFCDHSSVCALEGAMKDRMEIQNHCNRWAQDTVYIHQLPHSTAIKGSLGSYEAAAVTKI